MKRNERPLLLAVLLAAACVAPQPKAPETPEKPAAAAEAASATPPTEVAEASLRTNASRTFDLSPDLKAVPFDYDSAKLSDDALDILKANAAVLKASPDVQVRVDGHCDERGTVAYNLALGQKRAKQVRDYYMQLGVEGKRVATISYGKEQPLCTVSSEECWAKNRRAETRIRLKPGAVAAPAAAPATPAAAPVPTAP